MDVTLPPSITPFIPARAAGRSWPQTSEVERGEFKEVGDEWDVQTHTHTRIYIYIRRIKIYKLNKHLSLLVYIIYIYTYIHIYVIRIYTCM